jgi:hypothetical protein
MVVVKQEDIIDWFQKQEIQSPVDPPSILRDKAANDYRDDS